MAQAQLVLGLERADDRLMKGRVFARADERDARNLVEAYAKQLGQKPGDGNQGTFVSVSTVFAVDARGKLLATAYVPHTAIWTPQGAKAELLGYRRSAGSSRPRRAAPRPGRNAPPRRSAASGRRPAPRQVRGEPGPGELSIVYIIERGHRYRQQVLGHVKGLPAAKTEARELGRDLIDRYSHRWLPTDHVGLHVVNQAGKTLYSLSLD